MPPRHTLQEKINSMSVLEEDAVDALFDVSESSGKQDAEVHESDEDPAAVTENLKRLKQALSEVTGGSLRYNFSLLSVHSPQGYERLVSKFKTEAWRDPYLDQYLMVLLTAPLVNFDSFSDDFPLEIPHLASSLSDTPLQSTETAKTNTSTELTRSAGSSRSTQRLSSEGFASQHVPVNTPNVPASAGSLISAASPGTTGDKSESPGLRNNCTFHLGAICLKHNPVYPEQDLVSTIEHDRVGLKSRYIRADNPEKLNIWANTAIPPVTRLTRLTPESDIQRAFAASAMDTAIRVLNTTGHHVQGKTCLTSKAMEFPACSSFNNGTSADVVLSLCNGKGSSILGLVPVEVKKPSMAHLVSCLKWDYYWKFGGSRPKSDIPTKREMKQAMTIVKQLIGECFLYGTDEIPLWDGQILILIKFDFPTLQKLRRTQPMLDKERNIASEFEKLYPPERFRVIEFRTKVIKYDATDFSVTFALTALGWKKLMQFETKTLKDHWVGVRAASEKAFMDMTELRKFLRDKKKFNDAKKKEESKKKKSKGSGRTKESSVLVDHVTQLNYRPIQEGPEYVNQVVKMDGQTFGVSSQSVIFKVLDFNFLQEYYQANRGEETHDLSYDQFSRKCLDGYYREVECYRRIEEYNAKSGYRAIHSPRLIDHGSCFLYDDQGHVFDGLYVALEDLGEEKYMSVPPLGSDVFKKKLADQLEMLASIGIFHGDIAGRNLLERNGEVYVFDFNQAELDSI